MNKRNNGITLVALVITIIVLLILAGVSIALVVGDNGVLTRASDSKMANEKAEIYEQISLATSSGEIEYYANDTDRLTTYKNALLSGVNGIDGDSLTDNGSDLIFGIVTGKSGKKYDFTVHVSLGNVTLSEHEEIIVEITPVYAKLYDDGVLILSSTDYTDSSKTVIKNFGLVENKSNNNYWSSSEYNNLVTKVKFYDKIFPSTTAYYFNNLDSLTSFENMSNLDTRFVTDMKYMFAGCTSLTSIDLSHFNTSNVTNMNFMFAGKLIINTVGRVIENYYYYGGLVNLDLGSFDTSNVTGMYGMFRGQVLLQSINLSSFNTSNVTNMESMFEACPSLETLDLSSFDTCSLEICDEMFRCSKSSISQSGDWYYYYNDVRDVPSSLTRIYVSGDWDTSSFTHAYVNNQFGWCMFYGCESLSGAISYDSSKTNLDYANCTTGYFTLKTN